MDFLYDLPNWLMGLIVVGFTVAVALSGFFVSKRFNRPTLDDNDRAVLLQFLPIVATIQSLLLAFSAVSVWESYSTAESSVAGEANVVSELARDLAVFGSSESAQARLLLKSYTHTVVDREWPEMEHGAASQEAWDSFDTMFRGVAALQPDNAQRNALMPEIWSRTNELLKLRRERLQSAESEVPRTLWAVVVLGSLMTVGIGYFLPFTRFNISMMTALAVSLGLVFFFLIAMDRPFAGKESVDPTPFEVAIRNMERWDHQTVK